jgi:hypothetical protein
MADTKLKYWYDWEIYGPDGKMLVNLRNFLPPMDKDRLSDTDYLCQRIIDYPDSTLMNSDVWYRMTILRQQSFKSKEEEQEWKKVCKALQGDGRKRKTKEDLEDLQEMIQSEILFFREVLNRNRDERVTVERAIKDFLRQGDPQGEQAEDRRSQESNWNNVYYKYKGIYDKLKSEFNLSEAEIFCFFDKTASAIHSANADIDVRPDGRLLTFVKVKTWYVIGSDMHHTV